MARPMTGSGERFGRLEYLSRFSMSVTLRNGHPQQNVVITRL
jgi:hypothetical protein